MNQGGNTALQENEARLKELEGRTEKLKKEKEAVSNEIDKLKNDISKQQVCPFYFCFRFSLYDILFKCSLRGTTLVFLILPFPGLHVHAQAFAFALR